jgi:hypothetical protein
MDRDQVLRDLDELIPPGGAAVLVAGGAPETWSLPLGWTWLPRSAPATSAPSDASAPAPVPAPRSSTGREALLAFQPDGRFGEVIRTEAIIATRP